MKLRYVCDMFLCGLRLMSGSADYMRRRKRFRRGMGDAAAARATQVARSTIGRGLKDLRDPASSNGKVRRSGAGRLTLTVKDPTLLEDLCQLLEPATMGDPGRLLRWVGPGTGHPMRLARILDDSKTIQESPQTQP